MSKAIYLLKTGSRIVIDLERVHDRISERLFKVLSKNPEGVLISHKMTDATGVGVFLELNDGSKSWFFEDEILDFEQVNVDRNSSQTALTQIPEQEKSGLPSSNTEPLQRIKVDIKRVKDRIPARLFRILSEDCEGELVDYKMTDGMGVGVVLRLSDGSTSWFFDSEIILQPQQPNTLLMEFFDEKRSESRSIRQQDFFNGMIELLLPDQKLLIDNKLPGLLDPRNFIKWLLYSIKDIF